MVARNRLTLGVVSAYSKNVMRPAGAPSMLISKKTVGFDIVQKVNITVQQLVRVISER